MTTRIIVGDSREALRGLGSDSVQCCATSPPYFGLRDYGHAEQIGLEETPEAYVAQLVDVFREVRRVLRDDGTLWLNIGDSYAGNRGMASSDNRGLCDSRRRDNTPIPRSNMRVPGCKPKDLIGIPWMVAFALRDPYYTGPVKNEADRIWLAAMVDAEGSICGTEYESAGKTKTNLYISVTNTSVPIIDKCERLFPQAVKHVYEKSGPSERVCYRWDVERMDEKSLFLRTIYPYLLAKRKQAIVGYTFLEMQRGLPSKKKGYLPEQHEQRSWMMSALSRLNSGEDVDLPDWIIEPPSLEEPGFYLRQEIIWAKAQSGDDRGGSVMPESVTDRCTKAHEQVFLLTKSPTYYFNADAIAEPILSSESEAARAKQTGRGRQANASHYLGSPQRDHSGGYFAGEKANRRSVWRINTQPYAGAHFATMPPALIELCLLAGSREGDMVLDPFGGAGTTGLVADRLHRHAVLVELNPDYAALATERIRGESSLFAEVGP